jgi:hypothetical protein
VRVVVRGSRWEDPGLSCSRHEAQDDSKLWA